MTYNKRKFSLNIREKEVVNLVVSQVNDCAYCLAAHTQIAKKYKFTDEQILEIRRGAASFNEKLDALAKFTRTVTLNRGKVSAAHTNNLLEAGYTKGNLIDIITAIGDRTISNLINNVTEIPVDFPAAPALETNS